MAKETPLQPDDSLVPASLVQDAPHIELLLTGDSTQEETDAFYNWLFRAQKAGKQDGTKFISARDIACKDFAYAMIMRENLIEYSKKGDFSIANFSIESLKILLKTLKK